MVRALNCNEAGAITLNEVKKYIFFKYRLEIVALIKRTQEIVFNIYPNIIH